MSNIPCDVIKDLLPLYVDDVCSEKSKDMIEEHLAGCETCQQYYEALQGNLPEIVLFDSTEIQGENETSLEIEFIKNVSKRIRKKITINMIAIGSVVVIVMMLCFLSYTTSGNSLRYRLPFLEQRLKTEDVRVTEIYELENGDIYFTLESDEKISWSYPTQLAFDKDLGEDTIFYSLSTLTYSWWSDHIENNGYVHSCSFIYPVEVQRIDDSDLSDLCDISAIYYEGKNNNRITIWEAGQELEKAPANIEKRVDKYRPYDENDDEAWVIFNFE